MRNFLRGWKRKVGAVTVMIAVAFLGDWIESQVLTVQLFAAPDAEDAAQIKAWHALYKQRAAALVAEEQRTDEMIPLSLYNNPLQAFSNSVRPDQVHGTVHLWTFNGRPRIIGSVWSALDQKNQEQRNLCYEFHSLSESPVTIVVDGQIHWTPKAPGIDWLKLKESPVPAKTRPLRLAQMRQQMSEIRAEITTGESELRLLPQPVYRYPETVDDVIDGAIFAYVMGTDPEIFVLMEARTAKDSNEPVWSIAPVRFTGSGLTLKRDDTTVWNSPVWEHYSRDKIYDFLYGVEHLDAQQSITNDKSP